MPAITPPPSPVLEFNGR
uniref:Uncharacterized protein n=1 Tax=Rhizophora mucronata TaxID=61149 RepID=A0A2P2MP87_RHIMU